MFSCMHACDTRASLVQVMSFCQHSATSHSSRSNSPSSSGHPSPAERGHTSSALPRGFSSAHRSHVYLSYTAAGPTVRVRLSNCRRLTRCQIPWQHLPTQHTCHLTSSQEPSVTRASQHDRQRPGACRLGICTAVMGVCALQELSACWPVVCRPSAVASQSCMLYYSSPQSSRTFCQTAKSCLPSSSRHFRRRARRSSSSLCCFLVRLLPVTRQTWTRGGTA